MEYKLQAVKLMEEISDIIDSQTQTGPLERDNKTVWNTVLHRYRNEEWAIITGTLWILAEEDPSLFKTYHMETIVQARTVLVKDWDLHARILDTKRHKALAWKLMLTAKEVVDRIKATKTPTPAPTKYRDFFE